MPESKGRYWRDQRANIGYAAVCRTRGISKKLRGKSKVTVVMCKMLVDPKRNPVHDQLYKAQIKYHNLPVQTRQL
jgi:hypothetical protein